MVKKCQFTCIAIKITTHLTFAEPLIGKLLVSLLDFTALISVVVETFPRPHTYAEIMRLSGSSQV